MYRALLIKELREVLGIAAAALVAYLLAVTSGFATGLAPWSDSPRMIPFVDPSFAEMLGSIMTVFALLLGFKQTVGESVGSTYLFLLHRPVRRTRLIGVKLVVGLSVFLVCSAVPIVIYAVWAATAGTHASPFDWSMTLWTWQVWAMTVVVYLGGFLSGLRPARWLGTRLLPLAASGFLAVLAIACLYWSWSSSVLYWWRWWIGSALLVALSIALFVSTILLVARIRDYP